MYCQPHRVSSGQSNSGHKQREREREKKKKKKKKKLRERERERERVRQTKCTLTNAFNRGRGLRVSPYFASFVFTPPHVQ